MARTKRKGLRLLLEEQAQLEQLVESGYGATESEAARRAIREAYDTMNTETGYHVEVWHDQEQKPYHSPAMHFRAAANYAARAIEQHPKAHIAVWHGVAEVAQYRRWHGDAVFANEDIMHPEVHYIVAAMDRAAKAVCAE